MMPNAITLLFKEVRDTFPPIEGKPTDDDLQSIHEKLLPILMEIPYDQLGGTHSLVGILTDATRYATNHGGATFVCPLCLPLYDATIEDNATTVVCICAKSAHQAKLNDYASFEAAERGAAKFLCKVVDEVWYNDLKDANTFYTKVTAREIIAFLDANSGSLHAINMISLRTNMHNYYTQVDGIPQYINMLEDTQKKATQAGMPINNVKLVMMASAAVLTAQHFPRKVNDWEGLLSVSCTWTAWKTAFRLAHVKRQQQILASGGGEPLSGAHGVIPAAAPAIGHLETALNNLALAATNDTAVLQQLIAANLALTATITLLTATNKKLVDVATRRGGTLLTPGQGWTQAATPGRGWTRAATQAATPAATPAGICATNKPCPGNYCWTHGHCVSKHHTSATCANKAPGHRNDATASNTFGGSNKDKNWNTART
jgi:hypothetical protein